MRKCSEKHCIINLYTFIFITNRGGLQSPMFLCSKNSEIEYLLKQNNLHKWIFHCSKKRFVGRLNDIPIYIQVLYLFGDIFR